MNILAKIASIVSTICILIMTAGPASADTVDIVGTLGSSTTNCGTYTHQDDPSHTFMIGDSITHRGTDDLTALRPNWQIDGKTGRDVDCLVQFIQERLKDGYISRTVIALGTNAMEGWKQAQYQEVVDAIPASSTIIFVNTYRDPDLWPATNPFRTRASVQYFYSVYMANIAAGDRPGVCVANWRSWAANHPEHLTDGTHPDSVGEAQWASIVDQAGDDCTLPSKRLRR
jgi:hypothetical protein